MSHLFTALKERTRTYLGLDWLSEARDIAEEARRQREEDKAKAKRDPHDMARWLREPKEYRRPRPGGRV